MVPHDGSVKIFSKKLTKFQAPWIHCSKCGLINVGLLCQSNTSVNSRSVHPYPLLPSISGAHPRGLDISLPQGVWWPRDFHFTALSLLSNNKFDAKDVKFGIDLFSNNSTRGWNEMVDPQNKQLLEQYREIGLTWDLAWPEFAFVRAEVCPETKKSTLYFLAASWGIWTA